VTSSPTSTFGASPVEHNNDATGEGATTTGEAALAVTSARGESLDSASKKAEAPPLRVSGAEGPS
jgi:hypothetical protein